MPIDVNARYRFACIIEAIINGRVRNIEWQSPYDVKNLPDDLSKLEPDTVVEYWLIDDADKSKNLKITTIKGGCIGGLHLQRVLGVCLTHHDLTFDQCKEST